MKVHVYKVVEMFEVHVPESDVQQAMKVALQAVKAGEVAPSPMRTETGYIAIPSGNQDPSTPRREPQAQDIIAAMLQLKLRDRVRAVNEAGLLDPTDKPSDDPAAWISKVMSRASAKRKMRDLMTSIERCTPSDSL